MQYRLHRVDAVVPLSPAAASLNANCKLEKRYAPISPNFCILCRSNHLRLDFTGNGTDAIRFANAGR